MPNFIIQIAVMVFATLFALYVVNVFVLHENEQMASGLDANGKVIKDFSVSAGGFMHEDLCPVEFTDSSKITLDGSVCSELATGGMIVAEPQDGLANQLFGLKVIIYKVVK